MWLDRQAIMPSRSGAHDSNLVHMIQVINKPSGTRRELVKELWLRAYVGRNGEKNGHFRRQC